MRMEIFDCHILEDEGADVDIFIFYIVYVFNIGSGDFQPHKSSLSVTGMRDEDPSHHNTTQETLLPGKRKERELYKIGEYKIKHLFEDLFISPHTVSGLHSPSSVWKQHRSSVTSLLVAFKNKTFNITKKKTKRYMKTIEQYNYSSLGVNNYYR